MRRPTLAIMAALVLGCGGSTSSPGSSPDAGGGDDGGCPSSTTPGCPACQPTLGSPCDVPSGTSCPYSYSTGRYGAVCFCGSAADAGSTWSCAIGGGRRPDGLDAAPEPPRDVLAAYLEGCAFLEAASIDAFRILRRELAAQGAPRKLLRRASRAARDEARHARTMGALARRRGARSTRPSVASKGGRSIEELAVENAVEGCVRETYGALLATWQASHARDRGVRDAMRVIAREETQHAALSWEVARWADGRLDEAARRRVCGARARAIHALAAELASPPPYQLVEVMGIPGAEEAGRLFAGLVKALRMA